MNPKKLIWIGVFFGSTMGGFVPMLWNGGLMADVIWSGIGALAGIWLGFKVSQNF